jgi:hypothetical protein
MLTVSYQVGLGRKCGGSRSKVIAASVITAAILDLRLPVACDGIGSSTVEFLNLEKRRGGTRDMSGVRRPPTSVLRVSEKGSGLPGLKFHPKFVLTLKMVLPFMLFFRLPSFVCSPCLSRSPRSSKTMFTLPCCQTFFRLAV